MTIETTPDSHAETAEDAAEAVIAVDSPEYNARLVRRIAEGETLARFLVKLDGDPVPFQPGQYMTIGVFADGKILQRPYSVASSANTIDEGYELYIRLVEIKRFTETLWKLPVGQRMRLTGPKGKFFLEPEDARTHVFISTGTGIAPFISMTRTLLESGTPRKTVILHGVSYVDELGYRAELEGHERNGTYPITYVPTISRPKEARNAGWTGRTGRVETIVDSAFHDLGLDPASTVVYICGNPDMIVNAEATLAARGFPETHVKRELYWPKARPPKTL